MNTDTKTITHRNVSSRARFMGVETSEIVHVNGLTLALTGRIVKAYDTAERTTGVAYLSGAFVRPDSETAFVRFADDGKSIEPLKETGEDWVAILAMFEREYAGTATGRTPSVIVDYTVPEAFFNGIYATLSGGRVPHMDLPTQWDVPEATVDGKVVEAHTAQRIYRITYKADTDELLGYYKPEKGPVNKVAAIRLNASKAEPVGTPQEQVAEANKATAKAGK